MKKLVAFLLILITFAGCDTTKRNNLVLLIDNSTSVPEEVIQRFIRTIQQTLLPNMGNKDKLTVLFIDGCSKEKAERVYAIDLSEMDFANKLDGINNKDDSTNARLRHYLDIKVSTEIAKAINEKRKDRKKCGGYTDIINALNETEPLIRLNSNFKNKTDEIFNSAIGDESYEYKSCVIIFSDMVNENIARTFDFTTFGKLKSEDIDQKLIELKDQNKIPDLANVNVIVYGATSSKDVGPAFTDKQIENVHHFWESFFKISGAELKEYGYDTELELKNYLVKNK